ncbi:AIG1 family protein [Entamoeba histolytica KU27]|uniref:AIG1 family protein n=1 Tax=Entamoeba histolytica KU27 TaxID=885311 RepID=M2RTY7_ENTHI|nr:AIG1 family protein [Entamoeba histolytica KU27]
MSLQERGRTQLILVGETGAGKSSLGNYLLRNDENAFKSSSAPNSETKEAVGKYAKDAENGLFVIDTPGLNDTDNFDNEGIQKIINSVKVEGLQGIVLTMNFNVERFSTNLKQVVAVINDAFTIKDIWKHVCIVWTHCYNCFSKKKIEKGKIEKEQFKEDLIKFLKEKNGTNENIDIPMYFVDSQPDEDIDNSRSEKERERLIEWVRKIEHIDENETKKLISEYKQIRYEEKEETHITEETKYSVTYETNFYRRENKVMYTGEIKHGEWRVVSSRTRTEKTAKGIELFEKRKEEIRKMERKKKAARIVGIITCGVTSVALGAAGVFTFGATTVAAPFVGAGIGLATGAIEKSINKKGLKKIEAIESESQNDNVPLITAPDDQNGVSEN